MFDFISIVFDNETELNSLKIQLYSFKFVDNDIVNNIYILFNESKKKNDIFLNKFNDEIKSFCPDSLKKKLKIIFVSDFINIENYNSDWFSQQYVKLYVSKIITSEFYIVLDSKNHFIKNINIDTFIKNNKIIIYKAMHSPKLIEYYNNCFKYFGFENDNLFNPFTDPLKIQTTTPFILATNECKKMIDYIETKEKMTFFDFFYESKQYTEFFLYFSWICFNNKHTEYYEFIDTTIDNIIIGQADPSLYVWNTWEAKLKYYNLNNPSVFSISSKCVKIIDVNYKMNIRKLYFKIFKNILIDYILTLFFNISDIFCAEKYKILNNDLFNLNNEELLHHYLETGYYEKRYCNLLHVINYDFDVFVNCCGKSGSLTLYESLKNNNFKVLHTHGEKYFMNTNPIYIKFKLNLYELIQLNSLNKKIYIIDSYRNPIERKISSFFQNYEIKNNDTEESIMDLLNNYVILNENYSCMDETLNYFNIEKPKNFDFDKKYNIIDHKNIVFIKLRFNDIKEWDIILSKIFDKNITMLNSNLSINKKYHKMYEKIKSIYHVPECVLNNIKNNNEFKIYNTLDEQEKYIQLWSCKTKKYNYIYKNIPCDFDVKNYILLNDDLKNLTDEEAIIHYETIGFYEKKQYNFTNVKNDFDVNNYILLNDDLKNLTHEEAIKHYEITGFYEKRKY
jgi:hypothetical protein